MLKSKKSYSGLASRANYLIQHKLFIEENNLDNDKQFVVE
jgi:hypothetical protein